MFNNININIDLLLVILVVLIVIFLFIRLVLNVRHELKRIQAELKLRKIKKESSKSLSPIGFFDFFLYSQKALRIP